MKKINFLILIFIIVIFSTGILLSGCSKSKTDATRDPQPATRYYTCGMHPSVKVSAEDYNKGSKSCPICNMYLTPVYEEEKRDTSVKQSKVLFYRNPMNPSITSKAPAKDEMGMDYIPVYEETEGDDVYYGCGMEGAEHVFYMKEAKGMKCPMCGMELKKLSKEETEELKGVVSKVKIKGDQVRLAGVQTEPVRLLRLYKEVRTVGKVAYDPNLAIAQEEFIASLKALDRTQGGNIEEISERTMNLVESSRRKLRLLGLSDAQIKELEEKREVETSLILPEEKMWIYGDAYEYELSWVKAGEKVKVIATSLPGEAFSGIITSLNPVLDPKTRSVRFRAEVDNANLRLKPEMYVDVVIMSMYMGRDGEEEVLAISKDAVLDTGMRKIVWVDKGEQEYEGRIIDIGPEAKGVVDGRESKFYPVLKGLVEGENIVTKANFLIDSQSQISGVASSAYGGTVGALEEKAPAMHQH
ncbi:MAG: efflux RND transporter periplasmic adaptor subunit [Candidatus Omnitrophota bacterium]